jgi:hypothetical protein
MNEKHNSDQGTADEPALTQRNTETVRGETTLADESIADLVIDEGSTRVNLGVVPSSYGAAGGTTDATEEGGDGAGI